MIHLRIVVLPAILFALSGCADEVGYIPTQQQQRVIKDAGADQALAEAAIILKREFGRVQVDPGLRLVTTGWYEYSTDRDSGTARDLYRGRTTMRRRAYLSVSERGGATVARLRIDVERQDTGRQAVMHPRGTRLGDTPGQETAIDRDAATTLQQNTVWTRVRRDTKLESAILEELREKFSRLTADVGPAEPEITTTGAEETPE